MFEDNILLSLKRNYTRDEAFSFLVKELEKKDFKIGEYKSEIAELIDRIAKKDKSIAKRDKKIIELSNTIAILENGTSKDTRKYLKDKEEELYLEQSNLIKTLSDRLAEARKQIDVLQSQNFYLKNKPLG